MKNFLILAISIIAFVSCSKDEQDVKETEDCNCVRKVYTLKDPQSISFLREESSKCEPETGERVYYSDTVFYIVECN